MSAPPSFICPVCRRTSYNPNDIAHGYCGNCHAYTRDVFTGLEADLTQTELVQDVFAVAVPYQLLDEPHDVLIERLRVLACATTLMQFSGRDAPKMIGFTAMDWLVTADPEQIETFQPAHDCEQCRAGNEQARAYLRDNPGRKVALANLTYMEVWP